MPSEFTTHFTRQLTSPNSRPASPTSPLSTEDQKVPFRNDNSHGHSDAIVHRKTELHTLLSSISQQSLSAADVQSYARHLQEATTRRDAYTLEATRDDEVSALEEAIVGKLAVALYSNALDVYLSQAADIEAEAEWWLEVERSRVNVALYFLQTLPGRLFRVAQTIIRALQTNHLPLNFSNLSPSAIQSLFPSPSRLTLRPGLLATSFFPFLKHQKSLTVAVLLSPTKVPSTESGRARTLRDYAYSAYRYITLPLELTRQECIYTRKLLEQTRDRRAESLGELAKLRTTLSSLLHTKSTSVPFHQYTSFINLLTRIVSSGTHTAEASSPFISLTDLAQTLPSVSQTHTEFLRRNNLIRPSALTRMWPSFLVVPPMLVFAYANRVSWIKAVTDMTSDAKETIIGFVRGWLIEPLIGVLNTVRAGGKGEVLVREGGVVADLESLERMAISLARDSLQYTQEQLDILATRVRMGDLTPVMQIYEEDIKTPFRSAVTGTLLRNLFIQVQKAKVDIDQALSGIDHLLKSQELTFAFVGVAPALAVVYAVLGMSERLWNVVCGRGNLGGKQRRRAVWQGMRRIERILILHPTTDVGEPIGSLPTGLLLLSLTRLRSYALDHLPMRLRTPFLEDLGDLEDTNLDRQAKLRIVDRMWRSWGKVGEGVIVSS